MSFTDGAYAALKVATDLSINITIFKGSDHPCLL